MVTVSADDADKVYAVIVADIANLAQILATTKPYKSANGPDALLAFADHLVGIVAAVGVDTSGTAGRPVRDSRLIKS